jgi:hypothetical protein
MSFTRFRHWSSAVPTRNKIGRLLGYPRKLKTVVGDPRPRFGALFPAIHELASRYGPAADLTPFEYRVFSQNGEDGVIVEIVRRIGAACPRTFVEFGAGAGASGNTVFLADVLGWSGLFIEPAEDDFALLAEKYQAIDRVVTRQSFVGPENINTLVSAEAFPGGLGVISIDIDGNDYYVWQALTLRPAVVVIEYNGALPLRKRLVQPLSDVRWQGTDYFGASLGALIGLGARLGYTFVHSELSGTNAFFVADEHRERFADLAPPQRTVNYELLGMRHRPDTTGRTYLDVGGE